MDTQPDNYWIEWFDRKGGVKPTRGDDTTYGQIIL